MNTDKRTAATPVTLRFARSRGLLTYGHDRERSLADFPQERRVVRRPFCPAQRIAQPPVLSMRAGLAADASRRAARGGAGRQSAFAGSCDGGLPRYGRTCARPGNRLTAWCPIYLC